MSAVGSVIVGACGLLLVAGCGGGATKATTVRTAPPVATVTQSASPATTDSGSPLASADAVKSYVDAQASQDNPDAMRQGLKLAAPNSVAYIYLDHLANVSEAGLDGGQPYTKSEVTPVGSDAFKACSDPADETSCIIFGDFKVNPAGKLVDLTVNKQPIGPRLTAGSGQVVTAGGAKFTFLTAYKSIQSNALFVTVKVETGAKPIMMNTFTASYRGPDGKQRTASQAQGPTNLDAQSNAIVSMAFASVKVGGKVTLDGCVGKDCSGGQFTAVMKVG